MFNYVVLIRVLISNHGPTRNDFMKHKPNSKSPKTNKCSDYSERLCFECNMYTVDDVLFDCVVNSLQCTYQSQSIL